VAREEDQAAPAISTPTFPGGRQTGQHCQHFTNPRVTQSPANFGFLHLVTQYFRIYKVNPTEKLKTSYIYFWF